MGKIQVKVVPSSSKDVIMGWLGESLKVKVQAPPEKGKANAAVIELLAEHLGIDKSQIEIASGHSSPNKVLLIHGWSDEQIAHTLTS
ncbi:MAG: DUF167 domain-containing protein [Thainema sp.]